MDLNRAEHRRDARKHIGAILRELEPEDRIVVLEDLLADAHDAAPVRTRLPALNGLTKKSITSEPNEERPLWARVEEYCRRHPTVDGLYASKEVGLALNLADNPTTASNLVVAAVRRKSTTSDRPVKRPRFEWVGDGAGKFRLLTPQVQKEDE